jgi:hypothetical protein
VIFRSCGIPNLAGRVFFAREHWFFPRGCTHLSKEADLCSSNRTVHTDGGLGTEHEHEHDWRYTALNRYKAWAMPEKGACPQGNESIVRTLGWVSLLCECLFSSTDTWERLKKKNG